MFLFQRARILSGSMSLIFQVVDFNTKNHSCRGSGENGILLKFWAGLKKAIRSIFLPEVGLQISHLLRFRYLSHVQVRCFARFFFESELFSQ